MILDYGPPGTGKSTFAATLPRPGLTLFWDNPGKELPYHRTGIRVEQQIYDLQGEHYRVDDVFDAEGMLVWRIEHLKNVTNTQAVKGRIEALTTDPGDWQSLVLDSSTFMEFLARMDSKMNLNAGVKDGRQHYAYSKEYLEILYYMILGRIQIPNVMVIAHIGNSSVEINFEAMKAPAMPGTLPMQVGGAFSELYRSYTQADDKGNLGYWLQTQAGFGCVASSQIGAPNPSVPDWGWIEGETRGKG